MGATQRVAHARGTGAHRTTPRARRTGRRRYCTAHDRDTGEKSVYTLGDPHTRSSQALSIIFVDEQNDFWSLLASSIFVAFAERRGLAGAFDVKSAATARQFEPDPRPKLVAQVASLLGASVNERDGTPTHISRVAKDFDLIVVTNSAASYGEMSRDFAHIDENAMESSVRGPLIERVWELEAFLPALPRERQQPSDVVWSDSQMKSLIPNTGLLVSGWIAGVSWDEVPPPQLPPKEVCADNVHNDECSVLDADNVLQSVDYGKLVRTVQGCAELIDTLCLLPRSYRGEPMHSALDGALSRPRLPRGFLEVAPEYAVKHASMFVGDGMHAAPPAYLLHRFRSRRDGGDAANVKSSSSSDAHDVGYQQQQSQQLECGFPGEHPLVVFDDEYVATHEQYVDMQDVKCVVETWHAYQARHRRATHGRGDRWEEEALVLDTDVRIRGAGMRNMFHEASAMHGGFRKMIGDWLETMDFEEAVRLKWQRVRSFMYANGMEKFPTMAQLIEAGHEEVARDIKELGGPLQVRRVLKMTRRSYKKVNTVEERWERVRRFIADTGAERIPTILETKAAGKRGAKFRYDVRKLGGLNEVGRVLGMSSQKRGRPAKKRLKKGPAKKRGRPAKKQSQTTETQL
ncbi:hypothetical protein NFJ02_03g105230 [Pycnococcus provasolii]